MKVFAFDFETFLIEPYIQAPPIVCMSYAIDDEEPALVHAKDPRFLELLWRALHDRECKMVAHNAAFEIVCMLANLGAKSREWRRAIFAKLRQGGFVCTLLADRLIRIGRGIFNDDLALDDCMDFNHLPHKLDKSCWWRVRYGLLFPKPCSEWDQAAIDYSLGDTCVRELWASQNRDEYQRFLVTLNAQLEADVFLRLSTCWGFETDHDLAVQLYESVQKRIEEDELILLRKDMLKQTKDKGVWRWAKDTKVAKDRLTSAYAKFNVEPPRGDITPSMLAKAYKTIGIEIEYGKNDEVKDSDIQEALEYGVPAELLQGNISLNEESCLGCKDPLMESYTRYAQANTLFGKVKRLQYPLIQAQYLVLGAASGRTSCRQGEDPAPGEPWMGWGTQAQNPPRAVGVRDCFRARRHHAIVSCDFDTFELRTLTQQAYRLHLEDPITHPYPKMRDVLMDPKRDVHVELGAVILGLSVAEAYALKKKDKQAYKDMRQLAKALNFGAPGGLGKTTFVEFARVQYDVILTEERAEEVLEIWKDTWPEMRAYLNWASTQLREADPNSYKEKRKARGESIILGTEMVRGATSYCDFCNNQFQGLAAAAAKAGFVRLGYAMYDEEDSGVFGCRMLAFVHDEVLIEVPLATLHVTSHKVRDYFVAGAQALVPDVPLTSAPAAMYAWSKAAGDPVFDGKGELMVWEEWLVAEVLRTGKFGDHTYKTATSDQGLVRESSKLGALDDPNFDPVVLAWRACKIREREAA